MYGKMIRRQLSANRAVSLITVFFICAAAALLSLAAVLTANLTGAVDQLMRDSKTPHFMQMHTGEIDRDALERFSEEMGMWKRFRF